MRVMSEEEAEDAGGSASIGWKAWRGCLLPALQSNAIRPKSCDRSLRDSDLYRRRGPCGDVGLVVHGLGGLLV